MSIEEMVEMILRQVQQLKLAFMKYRHVAWLKYVRMV